VIHKRPDIENNKHLVGEYHIKIDCQPLKSMKTSVVLSMFSALLFSCNTSETLKISGDTLKIYRDNWKLNDGWAEDQLKGNPKEVKVLYYTNLQDTMFQEPAKETWWTLTRFDASGHIIFEYLFFDSSNSEERNYDIRPEGSHFRFLTFESADGRRVREQIGKVERIDSITFHAIVYTDSVKAENYTRRYFNNGDSLIVVSRYGDNTDSMISTYIYKNDHLVYKKTVNENGMFEDYSYYSSAGFLDSVINRTDGIRKHVKTRINNEYGDPVEMRVGGGRYRMKYEYDTKGNWIKQLRHPVTNDAGPVSTDKLKEYVLVKREIKY
jgi:hypothetical protein